MRRILVEPARVDGGEESVDSEPVEWLVPHGPAKAGPSGAFVPSPATRHCPNPIATNGEQCKAMEREALDDRIDPVLPGTQSRSG